MKERALNILAQLVATLTLLFAVPVYATDPIEIDHIATALKKNNHFALMRHAIAPGMGDPDDFNVLECETQRNLDQAGRDQATQIGALIGARLSEQVQIYSSEWCRCLETAERLALGPVTRLPLLNSFFQNRSRAEEQTDSLREWLLEQPLDEPTILVTHQVNITALTGVFPASGEIVIVERLTDGEFQVPGM